MNLWFEAGGDATSPSDDGSVSLLVNTVNCVGAYKAGVNKAFMERYPELIPDYKALCKGGEYSPGKPRRHRISSDVYVLNLPTKNDWRDGSQYPWIAGGLLLAGKAAENLALERGRKVTMRLPPPGCGNGGLDWSIVSRLVRGLCPGGDTVRVVICGLGEGDASVAGKRPVSAPVVAGIGSREAPPEILDRIRRVSRTMTMLGWGLRSGDASGCDAAFRDGHFQAEGDRIGSYVGYLANPNKSSRGQGSVYVDLEPWVYAVGGAFHEDPSRVGLTRSGGRTSVGQKADASAALISRNTFQLLGHDGVAPSDAVLCWTPNGSGSGGTGQAIRIARHVGIPVIDLGLRRFAEMSDTDLIRHVFAEMKARERVMSCKVSPLSEAPPFGPGRSDPVREADGDAVDFFSEGASERKGLIDPSDARRLAEAFHEESSRGAAIRELMDITGETSYGSLARLIGVGASSMARALRAEAGTGGIEP